MLTMVLLKGGFKQSGTNGAKELRKIQEVLTWIRFRRLKQGVDVLLDSGLLTTTVMEA